MRGGAKKMCWERGEAELAPAAQQRHRRTIPTASRRVARPLQALAVIALLIVPGGALPQEPGQPRIQTTVELVRVPVTVKDARGNLVSDLRRDEFRVLEDGVEQHIASFSTDAVPLSAVLLLDNSLPQKTAARLQSSLMALDAGFSESDEVALLVFDQYPETVLGLTADSNAVFTKLKRLQLGSHFPGEGSPAMTTGPRINATTVGPGVPVPLSRTEKQQGKNIDDAVYAAAQLLRNRPRERRKIIFLISDGNNSHRNTVSFEDTLRLLLSSGISVYSIDLGPPLLGPESSVLARFARLTGGDIFRADKREQLEPLYPLVAEQARTQYTLAYDPRGTDRKKDYHSIEVRVRRPDLTILARDGYFTGGTP
jgi:VWFA-related protein